MERVDVVIVGAGLAGLSVAATLASESKLEIMIIEGKDIGANRTIRAVFSEAVREFGLEDSILQDYTGYIFHSPLGAKASFDYRQSTFIAMDYRKACQILYTRAKRDGLELRKCKAVGWSPATPDPNRPLDIHLSDGRCVQTEILVDATGSDQWAARQLQIPRSRYHSVCYGELLRDCFLEEAPYFRFLAPNSHYGNGGGWLYPIGKDRISMGYSIVVPSDHRNRSHLAVGYWAAKQEFEPYASWVKRGTRERIEGGLIPVGRIGRFIDHRILIVGDAAGHAHPWSVEGCRPALYNGRQCALAVQYAFEKASFDRATLFSYERQWTKMNHERFWRTASVADVFWSQSDRQWDRFISNYQRLSPEQQLRYMVDNRVSFFHQIYAVGGFARRQLVRWLRRKIMPQKGAQ